MWPGAIDPMKLISPRCWICQPHGILIELDGWNPEIQIIHLAILQAFGLCGQHVRRLFSSQGWVKQFRQLTRLRARESSESLRSKISKASRTFPLALPAISGVEEIRGILPGPHSELALGLTSCASEGAMAACFFCNCFRGANKTPMPSEKLECKSVMLDPNH